MNLEDKHIDELFRSAANQSKAPEYHSSYWNEMEAMLNDFQKRRKGLLFWSSFGGVLMLALVSTLLLSVPLETKYSQVSVSLDTELMDLEKTTTKLGVTDNKVNQPSSNKQLNSKQETYGTGGADQQFNTPTTPKYQDKDVSIELTEAKPVQVEQLPLLSTNLGINKNRIDGEINEKIISTKQLPSFSPLTTSLEVGGGLSQVYDNNKSNPTLFNVALKLDYKLNNLIFSSGLGIMIEQNPAITVTDRAQVFGFGVTNFEQSLNYKTLVDMAVPVQVAYQSGKNRFGIGAQLRYLATSSMRFESKENGETMMADNLSGITTGLNPLNVDAYGFYERSLSKNLNLGVRITQQLTSRISSDKYFNNLDRTKVLNGQVYFKYTLFNH